MVAERFNARAYLTDRYAGSYRSSSDRSSDRDLREKNWPPQWGEGCSQGMGGSGIQAKTPCRTGANARFAWLCRHARRAHHRRGEHAQTAQHGRVYAVLLLSVARARASACLVQIGTLPLARRTGPPRRASRLRRRTSCRHGNSRVGTEMRYLVLPMRPLGTEGWSEEQLASIVTRDCMIGTGLPQLPDGTAP